MTESNNSTPSGTAAYKQMHQSAVITEKLKTVISGMAALAAVMLKLRDAMDRTNRAFTALKNISNTPRP